MTTLTIYDDAHPRIAHPRRIGLLAGWGRYPIVVARALRERGCDVYCLGIKEHADPALAEICTDFRWNGLGKLGRAVRYFKRQQVDCVAMGGKIHKFSLLNLLSLYRHLPDWAAIRRFWPHFISLEKDRRDDTLTYTVVEEFAAHGLPIVAPTDLVPEVLVKYGQLTDRAPSRAQRRDIEFGWTLAKEIGRLDIGQSVAVKDLAPLAVEAIEGTDECIRRAGQLCPSGGFTVVKVAKPQQDMRMDVPTIGLGTLQAMVEAGARVLAVEAHRTILLDEPDVVQFANRHRLTIVAVENGCWTEQQSDDSLAAAG